MTDLPLSCRCGAVRGAVRDAGPAVGTRLVCYCPDCQAYARHLGDDGLLDEAGGTELFQTSAGRLQLGSGQDRVACLRMTRRGPVRWYAACCNSAIANSPPSGSIPFAGICTARLGSADRDALGPVMARVFTEAAETVHGTPPQNFGVSKVFLRFVRVTMAARLAGDQRRHPFFPGGRALARPVVLTPAERRAAYHWPRGAT